MGSTSESDCGPLSQAGTSCEEVCDQEITQDQSDCLFALECTQLAVAFASQEGFEALCDSGGTGTTTGGTGSVCDENLKSSVTLPYILEADSPAMFYRVGECDYQLLGTADVDSKSRLDIEEIDSEFFGSTVYTMEVFDFDSRALSCSEISDLEWATGADLDNSDNYSTFGFLVKSSSVEVPGFPMNADGILPNGVGYGLGKYVVSGFDTPGIDELTKAEAEAAINEVKDAVETSTVELHITVTPSGTWFGSSAPEHVLHYDMVNNRSPKLTSID